MLVRVLVLVVVVVDSCWLWLHLLLMMMAGVLVSAGVVVRLCFDYCCRSDVILLLLSVIIFGMIVVDIVLAVVVYLFCDCVGICVFADVCVSCCRCQRSCSPHCWWC